MQNRSSLGHPERVMGRDGWIFFRAYTPAAALFGLAVLGAVFLGELAAGPPLAPVIDLFRWVPVAMAGGAILLFVSACYRLGRWWRGDGPSCTTCGGPLGREQQSRADRGGAYRRCYACGKAVNHVNYE